MAHIDRHELDEYPFDGVFYRIENDDDAPLDEQVSREVVIYETKCDIMEASHSRLGNFTAAAYAVHFPIKKTPNFVKPKRGDLFRANMYGTLVSGKVYGVFPSQLSGCTCYVDVTDVQAS